MHTGQWCPVLHVHIFNYVSPIRQSKVQCIYPRVQTSSRCSFLSVFSNVFYFYRHYIMVLRGILAIIPSSAQLMCMCCGTRSLQVTLMKLPNRYNCSGVGMVTQTYNCTILHLVQLLPDPLMTVNPLCTMILLLRVSS